MLRRIRARGTDGGALVLVLLSVLMVCALAASYLQLNSAFTRRQSNAVDMKEAFYVAEAGLTESFAGLTIGKTGRVGSEEEPAVFGGGMFWVSAEDLGGDLVRLDSTGLAGAGRAKLSSVVRRGSVSVAALGVFAADELDVLPGSRIDGYDSTQAQYADLTEEDLLELSSGRLGSNGAVEVSGTQQAPTVVLGDVTAGPGQEVESSSWATISGEVESLKVASPLPPVTSPPIALAGGIKHSKALPLVIPSGTRGLEHLRVGPNAEVQILGPALVRVGSLQVSPQGKLVLDNTAGSIQLYVDEKLALPEGSALEVLVPDPRSVTLQVAGASTEPLTLAANGTFYGVVYAPGHEVELGSAFEVFGALIAGRVTMLGPVRLHFDEALIESANDLALPVLVSWRILELGQMPGMAPGGSPFQLLGLDPALLPSPAEAHEDQFLEISYLDQGGNLVSWQGMESAFDWSDVSEPLTLERGGNQVPIFEQPGDGTAVVAAVPDPALQSLLDAIADPSFDSSDIRDVLLAAAPVPESALLAAMTRTPAMGSSHLRDVLNASLPLSEPSLLGMLGSILSTGDLQEVLSNASPLPLTVLDDVVNAPGLESDELADVLIENSPLPAGVLALLPLRIPPMDPFDLLAVLGAQ